MAVAEGHAGVEVPAPPGVRALLAANPVPEVLAGCAEWVVVRMDEPPSLGRLVAGVQAVLDRHDALRLMLRESGALLVRDAGAVRAEPLVAEVDGCPETEANRLAAQLDPRSGDVLRVGLLWDGVLLVAHPLAVAATSWPVLVADLEAACGGARPGGSGPAPAAQARAGARRGELAYWHGVLAPDGPRLGARPFDPAADTVATADRTWTVASPAMAEILLTRLPAACGPSPAEVLLAALALAVRSWRGPRDALCVTLDDGGPAGGFPVRVAADAVRSAADLAEALDGGPAAGRLLRAAATAVRATPRAGSGYGVLRHLDPDAPLAALPVPELRLAWFPQVRGVAWRADPPAVVERQGKALAAVLALAVSEAGDGSLAAEWTAAGRVLDADAVEDLQRHWEQALVGLAAHTPGSR
ncbi:hypothetical protein BJF78_02415 [Pseudonocardia sp. CNS-139]|nr:hypothetical protein BJF78_02415 [Pseudonocardia sp. CNS-139]